MRERKEKNTLQEMSTLQARRSSAHCVKHLVAVCVRSDVPLKALMQVWR
jgi:hypothetical protein